MSLFDPGKLKVEFMEDIAPEGPVLHRRYTLTHSDVTGELFLTIGQDFDREKLNNWYTRLMRDQVLAEWRGQANEWSLHVFCHVSGGLVFGPPAWRAQIFRKHMPQVLAALHHGDCRLFEKHPELLRARIKVHFLATQRHHKSLEDWGAPEDYQLQAG